MTLKAGNYIQVAHLEGPDSSPVSNRPEKASLTAAQAPKGTPLVNSSGYLTRATSAAAANIVGISTEDAHNNSSDGDEDISFVRSHPSVIFKGQVGAAVPTASLNIEDTDMWDTTGLVFDSTSGTWYLDKDEGSAGELCCTIVGFIDPIGTENGMVEFIFNEVGQFLNDT